MGCTCHLMRGETCSYCMEQIRELEAISEGYPDEVESEKLVFDTHHFRKMARHAVSYGMGTEKFKAALWQHDPDGPPTGRFGRTVAAAALAVSEEREIEAVRRRDMMRFIHQPDRSLREELRMGVYYDASGTE